MPVCIGKCHAPAKLIGAAPPDVCARRSGQCKDRGRYRRTHEHDLRTLAPFSGHIICVVGAHAPELRAGCQRAGCNGHMLSAVLHCGKLAPCRSALAYLQLCPCLCRPVRAVVLPGKHVVLVVVQKHVLRSEIDRCKRSCVCRGNGLPCAHRALTVLCNTLHAPLDIALRRERIGRHHHALTTHRDCVLRFAACYSPAECGRTPDYRPVICVLHVRCKGKLLCRCPVNKCTAAWSKAAEHGNDVLPHNAAVRLVGRAANTVYGELSSKVIVSACIQRACHAKL